MATIGPKINVAHMPIQKESGDGSTTAFTLDHTPGAANAIMVHVGLVYQVPNSGYTVSGNTITFTSAPPSGTDNIVIRYFGVELGIGTPADGTITQSKIDTSSLTPIIQIQEASTTAVVACTTVLPYDDTIPQNTEGTEVLTVSITPQSATSKLIIEFTSSGAVNTNGIVAGIALFQDSTANALAAGIGHYSSASTTIGQLNLTHTMTSGTTSATTFKIRIGPHVSGGVYPNGVSAGTRAFGGVSSTILKVTEVQQ